QPDAALMPINNRFYKTQAKTMPWDSAHHFRADTIKFVKHMRLGFKRNPISLISHLQQKDVLTLFQPDSDTTCCWCILHRIANQVGHHLNKLAIIPLYKKRPIAPHLDD